MKKRVFIVHGWGGFPAEGWFPWLKAELEKRGFDVQVPAMPHPETPTIEDWVSALVAAVGNKPDGQTYLVGHSMGCQTIMRYLASLPSGTSIGGALFVAGFFTLRALDAEEKVVAQPWLDTAINTARIRATTKNFAAIFSPTDRWVPIENKKFFEEKLGATTAIVDGKEGNHFGGSDGVTELPKALELVLAMSATPLISIDDVAKLEIKMGTILTAEKVEGADRLLKFSIDLGIEKRTIVSGVAQYYQPEVMVGRQVPVITNLAPRKMKGIESAGMIIYAIDESVVDGQPGHVTRMLNPDKEVPPGSPVM